MNHQIDRKRAIQVTIFYASLLPRGTGIYQLRIQSVDVSKELVLGGSFRLVQPSRLLANIERFSENASLSNRRSTKELVLGGLFQFIRPSHGKGLPRSSYSWRWFVSFAAAVSMAILGLLQYARKLLDQLPHKFPPDSQLSFSHFSGA